MSLQLLCVNYGEIGDMMKVLKHTLNQPILFDDLAMCHPRLVKLNDGMHSAKSVDQNTCWVKEVPDLVTCDHVLSVHWDGFIINTKMWDDAWLEYDYIGAPWPLTNLPNKEWRVGSGGFSMFSKRMSKAWGGICNTRENFDWQVGALYRDKFEALGMKYAPLEVAAKFAKEREIEDILIEEGSTFGFHGFQYGSGFRETYRKMVYG